jgi:phenylacetyl-CoA:acceptor oxidoreductase subunit 1
MSRWGMVIDLRKCIGCKACTKACKQVHKVPPDRWRRVVDCGISQPPERQRTFLPMNCMHCSEPPCLEVCPTTATYRRPDGIVDVHYEMCVGCSYCIVACPYLARTIIFHDGSDFDEAETTSQESDLVTPNLDHIGVATKCNFCLPRVDAGFPGVRGCL